MTNQQSFLLRSFTSFIFLYAGSKHVLQHQAILKKVSASRAYEWLNNESLFATAIILAGITMIAGGAALLLGIQVKKAAAILLAVLIPITLTVQLENLNDLGPFFKNIAITGSLLFIIKSKKYEDQTTPVSDHHPANRHVVGSANNKD